VCKATTDWRVLMGQKAQQESLESMVWTVFLEAQEYSEFTDPTEHMELRVPQDRKELWGRTAQLEEQPHREELKARGGREGLVS